MRSGSNQEPALVCFAIKCSTQQTGQKGATQQGPLLCMQDA